MSLNADKMRQALGALDLLLPKSVSLLIGGGGAMVLAYQFPLVTTDIDAIPKGMDQDELAPLIWKVAQELQLPNDWLNPWFSSFTLTLPADYRSRLQIVYQGAQLKVEALGKEDLLVMKCFAHRAKDIPHARALVRQGADTEFVMEHIENLRPKKLPHTQEALEFLDQILDMENTD